MQLHKKTTKGQEILGNVPDRDCIFILFVIQGHWMLWKKMRHKVSKLTNNVVFSDPLNNVATGIVHNLEDIAIQTISTEPLDYTIVLEGRHYVLHTPTQPNDWDCGF